VPFGAAQLRPRAGQRATPLQHVTPALLTCRGSPSPLCLEELMLGCPRQQGVWTAWRSPECWCCAEMLRRVAWVSPLSPVCPLHWARSRLLLRFWASLGLSTQQRVLATCWSPARSSGCPPCRETAWTTGSKPDPSLLTLLTPLFSRSEPEDSNGWPQGPAHHRQWHPDGLPQHAGYRRGQICSCDGCILP